MRYIANILPYEALTTRALTRVPTSVLARVLTRVLYLFKLPAVRSYLPWDPRVHVKECRDHHHIIDRRTQDNERNCR